MGEELDDEQLAAKREIWARYARLSPVGNNVLHCDTSRKERADPALWRWQGNDTKVILRDQTAAEAAALELAELYGHDEPMRAYRCPRTKRGHYHLTSDLEVRDA